MNTPKAAYTGSIEKGDSFTNTTGQVATVLSFQSDGNVVCYHEPNPTSIHPHRTALTMCGRANFLQRYPYRVNKSVATLVPAKIAQTWTMGWWMWKKTIDVETTQEASNKRGTKGLMIAKVRVIVDGKLRFHAAVDWYLPPGEQNLIAQVSVIARLTRLRLTFWARVLEEFIYRVDPHFESPKEASDPDWKPLVRFQEVN